MGVSDINEFAARVTDAAMTGIHHDTDIDELTDAVTDAVMLNMHQVSVGQCSMGVQVPFENAFVEPVNGGHIDDGDDSGVGRRHRHEVALLKQSRDRALIRSDYLSELLRSSSETEAHVERRHERKVFQLEQERDTARRDRDALHAQVEAMARVERRHQREVAQREQDVDDAHRGRELLQ
ncbi:hypothetical protein T484DRAFT_1758315, partial [Baffinella frigidus]